MKNMFRFGTALSFLFTLIFHSDIAFAQGSLTPPDAPAASMKTLAQIEPRTPISAAPFAINASGSYYLTTNLTVSSGDAITINANNVTLDLGGFTIRSTAASAAGYGIRINPSLRNLTIANGFIEGGVTNNGSGVFSGSGFANGIASSGFAPRNVLVARVVVSGCLLNGIALEATYPSVVESCAVRTVGARGISASTIEKSMATDCGDSAIFGQQVAHCNGESTGGYGVYGITVQNSYGYSANDSGLYAYTAQNCSGASYGASSSGVLASTAHNCVGINYAGGRGVYAYEIASGCYGYSLSGIGLYAYNASYCVGSQSGGTAIQATIANGCNAVLGTNLITYKYNMP